MAEFDSRMNAWQDRVNNDLAWRRDNFLLGFGEGTRLGARGHRAQPPTT